MYSYFVVLFFNVFYFFFFNRTTLTTEASERMKQESSSALSLAAEAHATALKRYAMSRFVLNFIIDSFSIVDLTTYSLLAL